jgi:putative MATE family efflux protein
MASTPPDLLKGPIVPTLLRLASPNVAGLFAQTLTVAYDGYIVARLGTDAVAGVALVFPLSMLMVQLSRAAMGGGVAAAVARALGAGARPKATAVAWHGLLIEMTLGLVVGLALFLLGPLLYRAMGANAGIMGFAQGYGLPIFLGAVATWTNNALSSMHVGSGNMRLPAACLMVNAAIHIGLCPLLVFGYGPVPALGVAGAGLSFVGLNAFSAAILAWPLLRGAGSLRLAPVPLSRADAHEVLRVGLPACVSPFITNGNVIVMTGYAGSFGTATLAGYGVGARLEYLLIPLVFGFGAALLSMVGRNIGAGQHERAARIAWVGALTVGAITGSVGAVLALFPHLWTQWFLPDGGGAARAVADQYLHIAGTFYAPFGFALSFFFACQGAGQLKWSLIGSVARLAVAIIGGALAVAAQSVPWLFVTVGLSFVAYAAIPAAAFHLGAWERKP